MAQSFESVRAEAAGCRACPLWHNATQAVFGEGTRPSRNHDGRRVARGQGGTDGRPFVGPAGRLLNEALDLAGIVRDEVFLTNVVKHFKFSGFCVEHRLAVD